jgi:hypothetical protein
MKPSEPRAQVLTAMLLVSMLTSGCATKALWEPQTYHPAERPELKLAVHEESRDLLAEYKEQREERKKYQSRAYWLFSSTNSIAQRGKPIFVSPKDYARLVPIPILEQVPATNAPPIAGYVAVPTAAQQGFDLYLDGCLLGRYYLPIYQAQPEPNAWRVAATPFAALGDTAVVVVVCVAVVAVVVGVIYLESGAH